MAVYNSQLVTRFLNQVNSAHPLANQPFEDAFELYHKIQEHDARHSPSSSSSNNTIGLPALGHALAGSTGTALSHLLLYPLSLVITRLQVQQQLKGPNEALLSAAGLADDAEYTSLLDAARKIYRHEGGLEAFWNGCATDTAKSVVDSFLFFLAYTALRQRQQQKLGTKSLPVYAEISVGMAAGALSKLVTTPIQQIVTRKQTAAMVAARDPTSSVSPNVSIKDIFLQIRSERGVGGFWAGYSASLILTLNPALTFLLQNLLKRILLPSSQRDKPGPKLTFLIAAVSKAAASTVTYPFSLAKSRAQVSRPMAQETQKSAPLPPPPAIEKPNPQNAPHQSAERAKKTLKTWVAENLAQLAIFRALTNIYKNEGVKGLYSGIEAEVVKGFLGHGLSMVLKERIHVLIISVYFSALKVMKRWPENLGDVGVQANREIERVRRAAEGVLEEAVEVGREVGGKVVEVGRDAGGLAVQAGRDVGGKVQGVGETVVEGVKSAVRDK